jgi:hypothetical protein
LRRSAERNPGTQLGARAPWLASTAIINLCLRTASTCMRSETENEAVGWSRFGCDQASRWVQSVPGCTRTRETRLATIRDEAAAAGSCRRNWRLQARSDPHAGLLGKGGMPSAVPSHARLDGAGSGPTPVAEMPTALFVQPAVGRSDPMMSMFVLHLKSGARLGPHKGHGQAGGVHRGPDPGADERGASGASTVASTVRLKLAFSRRDEPQVSACLQSIYSIPRATTQTNIP